MKIVLKPLYIITFIILTINRVLIYGFDRSIAGYIFERIVFFYFYYYININYGGFKL